MQDREAVPAFVGRWIATSEGEKGNPVTLHEDGTVEGSLPGESQWRTVPHEGRTAVVVSTPEAATRLLALDEDGVLVGRGGPLIRAMPEGVLYGEPFDIVIYWSINGEKNEYRLPERFALDDVIVDVGGHKGYFALAVLNRGCGLVHTVEPSAGNYGILSYNLASYGKRAEGWPCAAWRSDRGVCRLAMYQPEGAKHEAGFMVMGNHGQTVLGVPFDEILQHALAASRTGRIRLLKLDAEGSEWPILATTKYLHLISEIVGEYHLASLEQADPASLEGLPVFSAHWLHERLEQAGFTVEMVPHPKAEGLGNFYARRRKL